MQMMLFTFGKRQAGYPRMAAILELLVMLTTLSQGVFSDWMFDTNSNVQLAEGSKCQNRNGEPGICTRIDSCEPYVTKTIKYSDLVRCAFTGKVTEVVCCPQKDSPLGGTTQSGTVVTKGTTRTITDRILDDRPSVAACKSFRDFNPASLIFTILDGVPVAPGDYPHMGGLIYPLGGGTEVDVRCGSSLISKRYALTAAHCVDDPLSVPTAVRFGVVVWNSTEDGFIPVDVEIENITIHTEYKSHLRYHDIALIRLKSDVKFTPFIRPACLFSDMNDIDSTTPLVVIGWGVTNVQTRERSEVLLMTNVTTVALQECNATHIAYGVSRSYRNGLSGGHYCAYDPELRKDACQSDSGGPLQIVRNKESQIVGIVSFGLSCGSAIPAVYTRVAFYLDWLESIVWPS